MVFLFFCGNFPHWNLGVLGEASEASWRCSEAWLCQLLEIWLVCALNNHRNQVIFVHLLNSPPFKPDASRASWKSCFPLNGFIWICCMFFVWPKILFRGCAVGPRPCTKQFLARGSAHGSSGKTFLGLTLCSFDGLMKEHPLLRMLLGCFYAPRNLQKHPFDFCTDDAQGALTGVERHEMKWTHEGGAKLIGVYLGFKGCLRCSGWWSSTTEYVACAGH